MPLNLLAYEKVSGVNLQDDNSAVKEAYTRFGKRVMDLLTKNALEQNIPECTFMSNIRVMRNLLGASFTVESLHSGREFPREILKKKLGRRRRVCILQGVTRFLIVREITPKK